jgi:hypothetical protein
MILRTILAAAALLFAVPSAHAALDVGDLICETTTTTGTGTVNLGGAVTNYLTFVSQIASGNTVPYHIRASDGKLETGIGTFTDGAPDTLTRTADWSSDGSGAELTLPAGTHNVCLGPISGSIAHKTGTPVATQVALWNSSYLVEGTAALSFDGNTMYIYRVSDGAAGGSLSVGLDSNSLAANDIPFRLFGFVTGDDDEPNLGLIEIAVEDATNDAEIGRIDFRICSGDDGTLAGCPTELQIHTTTLQPFTTDGLALGASGKAFSDLFLASGGVINWDAGDVLFTHSANTLTVSGVGANGFVIGDASAPLKLEFTDDGSSGGPNFATFRNSTTPAVNDPLGGFIARGNDLTPAEQVYASISAKIGAATAGAHTGYWAFDSRVAAVNATRAIIGDGMIVGSSTTLPGAGNLRVDGYYLMPEIADPGASAANTARLYVRDNGSGKTQIVVIFPSGAVQVLATEP